MGRHAVVSQSCPRQLRHEADKGACLRRSRGLGSVHPPIIVDEHGDISVFEALDDVERYIEPIDVRNNEYVFYDASGQVLHAEITRQRKEGRLARAVSIVSGTSEVIILRPTDKLRPVALESALKSYLLRVGNDKGNLSDEQVARLSLEELVEMVPRMNGVGGV